MLQGPFQGGREGVDWVASPPSPFGTAQHKNIIRGKTYGNTWAPKKWSKLPSGVRCTVLEANGDNTFP